MRLKDRIVVLVGAGQGPGEGMGNGRATALRFAQEGARVLCVDRDLASAEETAGMIRGAGGEAAAFEAGVVQNLPFLGHTGARSTPACEGRISTGEVPCAGGGRPPPRHARWG